MIKLAQVCVFSTKLRAADLLFGFKLRLSNDRKQCKNNVLLSSAPLSSAPLLLNYNSFGQNKCAGDKHWKTLHCISLHRSMIPIQIILNKSDGSHFVRALLFTSLRSNQLFGTKSQQIEFIGMENFEDDNGGGGTLSNETAFAHNFHFANMDEWQTCLTTTVYHSNLQLIWVFAFLLAHTLLKLQ